MGFFDRPLFDFNGDGKEDGFETLADMDDDERREALEDTGLDPDGYDDF